MWQCAETVDQHRQKLYYEDDTEENDEQHTDGFKLQVLLGDCYLKLHQTQVK